MDKWQWGGTGIAVVAIFLPMTGLVSQVAGWVGVAVGVGMIVAPFVYHRGSSEPLPHGADDLRDVPPSLLVRVKPAVAQEVRRDTTLNAGLRYAATGTWDQAASFDSADYLAAFSNRLREFRQLAFDGRLKAWGKRSPFGGGVHEEIPREYWRDYTVDFLEALKASSATENYLGVFNPDNPLYYEVMVSRVEFEREYPHG